MKDTHKTSNTLFSIYDTVGYVMDIQIDTKETLFKYFNSFSKHDFYVRHAYRSM